MKFFKLLVLSSFVVAGLAHANFNIQVNQNTEPSEGAPTGKTSYFSYNFGRVWTNSMNSVRYDVTNTGTTPLNFISATISGIGYDAYHSCSAGLQPTQKCWFEIRYWPSFEGFHSGRFVISFSDANQIVVDLWGEAHRP